MTTKDSFDQYEAGPNVLLGNELKNQHEEAEEIVRSLFLEYGRWSG